MPGRKAIDGRGSTEELIGIRTDGPTFATENFNLRSLGWSYKRRKTKCGAAAINNILRNRADEYQYIVEILPN